METNIIREKAFTYGAETLTTAELLYLLLKNVDGDTISELNDISTLANTSPLELLTYTGIGKEKAAQLVVAIELGKRIATSSKQVGDKLTDAETVANLLMPEMRHLTSEHFKVLYLNVKGQMLRVETEFIGGLDCTVIDVRKIFQHALKYNAASIILAHNHPSGDTKPSREDIDMTEKIKQAGKVLNIKVLDHIIIGDGKYTSFAEMDLL